MNEHLRDRILRKLEALSDERGYQVLDYVDFLESKYAERPGGTASVFTRFAEAIEDRLRAGQVSASAVAETMSLMNKAMGVLNGVAAAGKSVANDIVGAAARQTAPRPGAPPSAAPPPPSSPPAPAAPTSPPGAPHASESGHGAPPPPQPGTTSQPPGEQRS